MADSAAGLERLSDIPSYSPVIGGNAPIDRARSGPADIAGPPADDLASLIKQGNDKLQSGDDGGAERFLCKAMEVADRTLPPDSPELMLLLSDLTRFYLRKSAYASAEPLLLRLVELKRSKGEDHPEVATVLASLANVRQALGHHESAEQLWRRVLDIRERTLAPNHFAVASALEHLGESCAARGKIAEALESFQRAHSIRERTMGAEHPSLRVSRERIADLELQASEGGFGAPMEAAPRISPEKYRLTSGEPAPPTGPTLSIRERPATSSPPAREKSSGPNRKATVVIAGPFASEQGSTNATAAPVTATPPVATAAPVATPAAVLTTVPYAPTALMEPAVAAQIVLPGVPMEGATFTEPVGYRDLLESLRDEMEQPYQQSGFAQRSGEMARSAMALLQKRQVVAGGVVVVLALVLVTAFSQSHAFGESPSRSSAGSGSAPVQQVAVTPQPASAIAPGVKDAPVEINIDATNSKSGANHARVADNRPAPSKKEPEKKTDKTLEIPTVSGAIMSKLNQVAASAADAAPALPDPMAANVPAPISTRRANFAEDEQTAPQRAKLIGELPNPRIPTLAMDFEGQVRVRFNVDPLGRPVMESLVVLASPSPLLTAAVRKVIPDMRFEPARSAGPDSRAISDVVQIGFDFSRRK